jgi:hypothetical protein
MTGLDLPSAFTVQAGSERSGSLPEKDQLQRQTDPIRRNLLDQLRKNLDVGT